MSPPRAPARSRDDVLAELREIASGRHHHQGEADRLYQRQVELYVEAREFDPPILQREIADAAGSKVIAVNAAITKLLAQRAAKKNGR